MDTPKEREHAREHAKIDEIAPDVASDDLFTDALIYLHDADDALDSGNEREFAQHMARARELMSAAIALRATEHVDIPLVQNIVLETRATDIGVVVPHVRLPNVVAPRNVDAEDHHVAVWTSDAENVHDSAVGQSITNRIAFLKSRDIHVHQTNECVGAIWARLRSLPEITDAKKGRILATLNIAAQNNNCERYGVGELEILRIVFERQYFAENVEEANNISQALIDAIADCAYWNVSEGVSTGTVCLVGRISRYVHSLEIVDSRVPEDPAKTTEAYRAEIMESLGRLQATDHEMTRADIAELLEGYRDRLPAHVFNRIATECYGALD
jgi:hypothetical protein